MSIIWDSWYPCTYLLQMCMCQVFWNLPLKKIYPWVVTWLSILCHILNFLGFSDPENDDDSRKKGSQSYKKYDPVNAVMDKIDAELSSMVGNVNFFFSLFPLGRVCLVYIYNWVPVQQYNCKFMNWFCRKATMGQFRAQGEINHNP